MNINMLNGRSPGLTFTGEQIESFNQYLGGGSYEDFITSFCNEPQFIPLFYKSGALVYNNVLKSNVSASVSDMFYNIESW